MKRIISVLLLLLIAIPSYASRYNISPEAFETALYIMLVLLSIGGTILYFVMKKKFKD